MSDKLRYQLEVTISSGTRIDNVEEILEDSLLDLYDNDGVEAVLVKDRTEPLDDDMDEIIDVIDELNSHSIQLAIDSVEALGVDET